MNDLIMNLIRDKSGKHSDFLNGRNRFLISTFLMSNIQLRKYSDIFYQLRCLSEYIDNKSSIGSDSHSSINTICISIFILIIFRKKVKKYLAHDSLFMLVSK